MRKISETLWEACGYLAPTYSFSDPNFDPFSCNAVGMVLQESSGTAERWYFTWLKEMLTLTSTSTFAELTPHVHPEVETQRIRFMLLCFAALQAEEEGL